MTSFFFLHFQTLKNTKVSNDLKLNTHLFARAHHHGSFAARSKEFQQLWPGLKKVKLGRDGAGPVVKCALLMVSVRHLMVGFIHQNVGIL